MLLDPAKRRTIEEKKQITETTTPAVAGGLRAARKEQQQMRKQAEAPANPPEARKELAAAKQRHPAGSKAPGKAVAKTAAKKTPAKTAGVKLRWLVDGDRCTDVGKVRQSATFGGGLVAIEPSGDKFRAVYTEGKRVTVLLKDGTFGACYRAVRNHVEGAVAA